MLIAGIVRGGCVSSAVERLAIWRFGRQWDSVHSKSELWTPTWWGLRLVGGTKVDRDGLQWSYCNAQKEEVPVETIFKSGSKSLEMAQAALKGRQEKKAGPKM